MRPLSGPSAVRAVRRPRRVAWPHGEEPSRSSDQADSARIASAPRRAATTGAPIRAYRGTSAAGRSPRRPTGAACRSSQRSGPPPHRTRGFLWFVLALIALNWLAVLLFQPSSSEPARAGALQPDLPQSTSRPARSSRSRPRETRSRGPTRAKQTYPPNDKSAEPTKQFATQVPSFWNNAELTSLLQAGNVEINAESTETHTSLLAELLLGFGPTLLIVGLFVLLARRAASAGGGLGGLGNFGRSQARRVDPEQVRVTFADVAGIDEAKAELTEIVDFLKSPERYSRLGGRMPHGVLLSGAPGTGKTLLARAVAGEAHAAFFSISASEFIEAIVGVGASRVRDLFSKAKEAAPSIIFIDELDAIGRSRQGTVSVTGANDEREQTLDQILTEMDGFESSQAVVVLAATNRPDVLDSALLRPGRFDRRVAVQPPDRKGRRQILEVHTRHIRWPRTWISKKSPRAHPGWSARTWPTSPTRPPSWPPAATTPRSSPRISPTRWRRSCSAPPRDRARARGPRTDRLPRVRSRPRRDAHPGRRPGPQGLDHPARHGPRGHAVDPGLRTASPIRAKTCARRSRWRWAAASPRRSSTGRSRAGPSPTSSSSPRSPARWSAAGA